MTASRSGQVLTRRTFVRRAAKFSAVAILSSCGAVSRAPTTPKIRHIGWLSSNTTAVNQPSLDVWREALRDLGYLEGRDIVIDTRIAENVRDRLPGIAAELASLPVDVLVATTGEAALAAKQATSTIPIVFVQVPDPVGLGLVASLARPGGNATGTSTLSRAISGKKLELLKEAVPGLAQLAVLWNAHNFASMSIVLRETEEMARTFGLTTKAYGVATAEEVDPAFDAIAIQRPDAVLALPIGSVPRDFAQIPDFAARLGLPALYSDEQLARAGGLMHLGPNYPALFRRAAGFVDKILRGASPADLPVEQATQFDFIVNLSAARRIGFTIPDGVLRQATEVIR